VVAKLTPACEKHSCSDGRLYYLRFKNLENDLVKQDPSQTSYVKLVFEIHDNVETHIRATHRLPLRFTSVFGQVCSHTVGFAVP
jgi:hypothetical protein